MRIDSKTKTTSHELNRALESDGWKLEQCLFYKKGDKFIAAHCDNSMIVQEIYGTQLDYKIDDTGKLNVHRETPIEISDIKEYVMREVSKEDIFSLILQDKINKEIEFRKTIIRYTSKVLSDCYTKDDKDWISKLESLMEDCLELRTADSYNKLIYEGLFVFDKSLTIQKIKTAGF
jgi:hypothetical protein